MAENRYNVDDILREVKAKRAREGQSSQTERKAAATTTEDLLRQLEAAQTGLPKAAKPAAKPAPALQPPQKAETDPAELLKKTESPAVQQKAEPEFHWEEPRQETPVMQPEEWTAPKKETPPMAEAMGEEAPLAGREIPVTKPKKPLWEASAARKSAEAVMQTLKKRQRGLAVTLIDPETMGHGGAHRRFGPLLRRHAGQWLFGAVPRPAEQRCLCDADGICLPAAGQLYGGAARPAGTVWQ